MGDLMLQLLVVFHLLLVVIGLVDQVKPLLLHLLELFLVRLGLFQVFLKGSHGLVLLEFLLFDGLYVGALGYHSLHELLDIGL